MSGRRRLRRGGLALLAVALAASGASLGSAGSVAAKPDDPPSRLLVTSAEWSMTLSRAELAPGPSIIQMYNRGEDAHNLRIQKGSGGPIRRIAELEPGETGTLETRLQKGTRYKLWCSLPLHADLGMRSTVKVTRR